MCRKMIYLVSFVLVFSVAGNTSAELVGYWKFDEGSGTIAYDSSGNGLDGTLNGDPQWVTGQLGGALDFDGDDSVEIPHNPLLSITDEITITAWTYMRANASGELAIVSKGGWAANDLPYELTETPGGVIFWQFYDDGGRDTCAPDSPPVDEWHHIAGTYDGQIFKCYIDGELADEWAYAGTMPENTASVTIGQRSRGGTYFNGVIDEVAIYNRALSEDEIPKIMMGLGGFGQASAPNPANGALHEDTWVSLSWRAGDFAVSHDVYFGENFDDVNAGAEGTFQGNQIPTFFVVGFPGFPYPDGLIPGTTYYWRIDEVNDTEPNSPWKGDVWSFMVPPKTAYAPDPADAAEQVEPDADLSWTAGFGAKLHTVYFGDNFDEVDNDTGGLPQGAATYEPGTLKLAQTYYWRVDEFDAIATYKGDVWSFTTQGAVGNPDPANGAVDIKQTPILTWTPGIYAASHQLYFGTDKEVVRNADTGSPEYKGTRDLGSESHDPGKLLWDTTYYWRIDEVNNVNPDSPWIGPVWSFTTANFLIVDDFEAYNDLDPADPESNRIFNVWIDGYDDPTNGSLVGSDIPPFAEQTIVHGGNQSLPLYYDNSVGYSEATLTLTYPRDWTEKGVSTLTIWFRGNSDNAAETLYVALNGSAVVSHDNPDAAQINEWTQWDIDLQAFGINLANVNTIALGLGNRNPDVSGAAGGSGTMYFDDIRLYPPAPPEVPEGMVTLWNFDEGSGDTAADSSGNGLDGTISGATWVSPGADGTGSCLDFDGQGTNRVSVGTFDVTGNAISIACWYKADNLDTPGNDPRLISKAIGGSSEEHWFMVSSSRVGGTKVLRFRLKTDGTTGELKADAATGNIELDVWTHAAAVWDGATMRLYKNGVEVGSIDKGGTLSTNPDAKVSIGNQPAETGDRPWDGLIDDVQIYNRGLSEDEIAELAGL